MYGTVSYWETRYTKCFEEELPSPEKGGETDDPQIFEWFGGYGTFRQFIEPLLQGVSSDKSKVSIVELGCGNSALCEELYDEGYTSLTAVDFSPAVIDKMVARSVGLRTSPPISYSVMDAREMAFPDCSTDVVIDKGLLDAMLNEWDEWMRLKKWNSAKQSEFDGHKSAADGHRALAEVYRVLRPGGCYVMISYELSDGRLPFLQEGGSLDWTVTSQEDELGNNIYICRKPA